MHPIQKKILKEAKINDVLALGIRPLGRLIGVDKPQLVKHHLAQLQKKGLIKPKSGSEIRQIFRHDSIMQPTLIQIPVVGAANCGQPTLIADERVEEYITVSQSLVKKGGNIFALIAKGSSLNKANINGKAIEDNDYIIVDGNKRDPLPGDYILSIIGNEANVKKYARTKDGNIALLSESTSSYPPIYIGENDQFIVNGKVIQVIKAVK